MLRATKVLSSCRQKGPSEEWGGDGELTCLCPHLAPSLPLWFPLGSLRRKCFEKDESSPVNHRKAFCLGVDSPGRIILPARGQGKLTLGLGGQMVSGQTTQFYHDGAKMSWAWGNHKSQYLGGDGRMIRSSKPASAT